jgi:hypothetical protein
MNQSTGQAVPGGTAIPAGVFYAHLSHISACITGLFIKLEIRQKSSRGFGEFYAGWPIQRFGCPNAIRQRYANTMLRSLSQPK